MSDSRQNDRLMVEGAIIRYVDSYRVARTAIAIGNVIKVVCIAIGVLIFIGAIKAGVDQGMLGSIVLLGFAFGLVIAVLFFLLGIIVASQGQMMIAALDTAVCSSPFLTDEDKAIAMSLRITRSGR